VLDDDMKAAFWINYRVQPITVAYTVGIAIVAALIVGAVPALQATGRKLQTNLRQLGGSALRLGRVWTTLIVAQVGIAVAVLPAAVSFTWTQARGALTHYAYDAREFASATLQIDATDEDGRATTPARPFGDELSEMIRQIGSDPSIAGVTYESALPGRFGRIEVDGVDPSAAMIPQIFSNGIAPNYFDVHGVRILAGRGLDAGDLDTAAAGVVVNRAFVDRVLAGAPALGRRVRYAARPATSESPEVPPGRWFRIVGVVANARTNDMAPDVIPPELYYGVAPSMAGTGAPVVIAMRMRASTAEAIAPRVREIAARINPGFRFGKITTQSKLDEQTQTSIRLIATAIGLVLVVVFLLSAAGVYALVSFTVTRRRREIGIRAALGASQRQVLAGVLGPVARQIALGVMIGIGGAAALDRVSNAGLFTGKSGVLLPVFGILMSVVALLAAFGPARRGLRTQPTEALRES
jgi:hypothetical protein